MANILTKATPKELIISDIKIELAKLTNLVKKRCCVCSKCQATQRLFAYETKNELFYVCSTCIIKLALNDLTEQYSSLDNQSTFLLKKELEALNSYIYSLISDSVKKITDRL